MSDPRYPIGKFKFEGTTSEAQRNQFIEDIEQTPAALRSAIKNLDAKQIETPYRDGGWTVRQVVHHVPESHMNAYIRFKLALTEDEPTIKPYMEDRWAVTGDVNSTPLDGYSMILGRLAKRTWRKVAKSGTACTSAIPYFTDFNVTFVYFNPESEVALCATTTMMSPSLVIVYPPNENEKKRYSNSGESSARADHSCPAQKCV